MRNIFLKGKNDEVNIQLIETNDLLSDNDKYFERNRKFGTWDDLLGSFIKEKGKKRYRTKCYEWIKLKILRDVIREFCTLIIEDMIYDNDSYDFQGGRFAKLTIGCFHPKSAVYKPNPETFGVTYQPIFVFTKRSFQKIKVQYYLVFTDRWRKKLKEEINKGHQYETPNYEHRKISTRKSGI